MDFLKTMSVGVCYYPEHWDESLWESDLKRMLDNGIHTVRIGEFAWSIMEREEGSFDFSFFDRFLDLCASTGMQVIFGTPTATPPAWLTCRYPETLNANAVDAPAEHVPAEEPLAREVEVGVWVLFGEGVAGVAAEGARVRNDDFQTRMARQKAVEVVIAGGVQVQDHAQFADHIQYFRQFRCRIFTVALDVACDFADPAEAHVVEAFDGGD